MASLGSQFTLLLWKNFTLQGRKKCVTVFEILVPLFFAGLLLMIRAVVDSEYINHDTQYDRFSISDLFISRFGFKSGVCLLIAPVPVHCFSITYTMRMYTYFHITLCYQMHSYLVTYLNQSKV